jgi:hypothetical protein
MAALARVPLRSLKLGIPLPHEAGGDGALRSDCDLGSTRECFGFSPA